MILQSIKDSGLFLTAKGKFVDTYEMHSFGASLLIGLMWYMEAVPNEAVQVLHIVVLSTALGVQAVSKEEDKGSLTDKLMDSVFSNKLRKQISAEGHYAILGLSVPHIVNWVIRSGLI